jgi:hypothetical protein
MMKLSDNSLTTIVPHSAVCVLQCHDAGLGDLQASKSAPYGYKKFYAKGVWCATQVRSGLIGVIRIMPAE